MRDVVMPQFINNRYLDDRISEWELNPIQMRFRKRLLEKLESGAYGTESIEKCMCGSKDLEQLSAKDRYGLPFGNIICKACGLIMCSPRLKGESLPVFYTSEYHGLVFGSENVADFEHMVRKEQGRLIFNFLKNHLLGKKKISVAEIGAGVGNNLRTIHEEAKKIGIEVEAYGCEYSGECVKYGIEQYGLNLVQGGTGSLSKFGVKFDLIIMSHVLEHFTDPLHELKLVQGMLGGDALVYVEVPGVMDLHNKIEYQCDFLRYTVVAHMYNFCLGTLTNLMGDAGYEIVEGNEYVRSIFRIGQPPQGTRLSYYHKISEYLKDIEHDRRLLYELNISKAELFKITNRVGEMVTLLKRLDGEGRPPLRSSESVQALKQRLLDLDAEKIKLESVYREKIEDLQKEHTTSMEAHRKEIENLLREQKRLEETHWVERDTLLARLRRMEDKHKAEVARLLAEHVQAEDGLREEMAAYKSKYDQLYHHFDVIMNSVSWRITVPIRRLKELLFPKWKG